KNQVVCARCHLTGLASVMDCAQQSSSLRGSANMAVARLTSSYRASRVPEAIIEASFVFMGVSTLNGHEPRQTIQPHRSRTRLRSSPILRAVSPGLHECIYNCSRCGSVRPD